MAKLNIQVNYSALYRPESQGLLERQHRDIKESLKAAIEDMVDKHQGKWLDQLPFVLLGKRVALQPDLGASPSELAFGLNVRIPGQILRDPGELETEEELRSLLEQVRRNTNNPPVQTSRHIQPEKPLASIPDNVTHVYTRQHKAVGLQTPWEGPFRIESRPSRSTVQLDVGTYKNGEKRYEIRHFNDLKLAHPDSAAAEAVRPKLGRPPKTSIQPGGQQSTDQPPPPTEPVKTDGVPFPHPTSTGRVGNETILSDGVANKNRVSHATSIQSRRVPASGREDGLPIETGPPPQTFSGRPARSTRNPNPYYVDSFQISPVPWSATPADIEAINASISRLA